MTQALYAHTNNKRKMKKKKNKAKNPADLSDLRVALP
jgi:CHAD domain-containing protein